MKRAKAIGGYTVAAILLVAVLGFFGAPEYCSGRVSGSSELVYDQDGFVISDCTPWLRYLLLGH